MKQAIQKATEGGWKAGKDYHFIKDPVLERGYECLALLDKDFWQALGKGLRWPSDPDIEWEINNEIVLISEWQWCWHRFIDKLASGGTPDEFFKELLT